jgi:protoporphyrinogen oxidase
MTMETEDIQEDARPEIPEHVVVLGAGPAGLAAAHELATRGVRVTVLERAPWVGGLSITWEQDGFRFDIGGHRWFTKKDWLNNWFLNLMEGELVTVFRTSRIYFGGKYIDYPVKIGNVFRTTGIVTSVHAVISYAIQQVKAFVSPSKVETIEQAYVAQFGQKLYEMFFKRYTEKVWGRDCTLLSADWVAQRTKGLSILQTIQNAIVPIKTRPGAEKIETLVDTFVYPKYGYQRICERMKDDIEANGGAVVLESNVVGVNVLKEGGVVVRYRDRNDDAIHEIAAEHTISTIPLGRLVQIMDPPAPCAVIDAAKGLEFRSVVTTNIMLKKDQVTPDTWLYVHDDAIGFARIHEPRNWSEAMCPPGTTSICAEWFCTEGDDTWRMDDQELVDRTVGHLADDLGFIDRSEVIGGFALRARQAYPVYSLDYEGRVSAIKGQIQRYSDAISIAGRGGTFRYNNADHSIETGLLVAKQILGEDVDAEGVNTEQEYHEERRVER